MFKGEQNGNCKMNEVHVVVDVSACLCYCYEGTDTKKSCDLGLDGFQD